jgi:molecular chaperone GrpE
MTPPKKKAQKGDEIPSVEPGEELAEALREAAEAVAPSVTEPGTEAGEGAAAEAAGPGDEALAQTRELDEARDRLVRLQAEFENFRRRSLKERQESLQYGHQNLVKDLLGTVDNLERAIAHSTEDASASMESVLQGVELVQRELLGALGKHGVKVVEPLKEVFDPTFHEAMGQLPDASVAPNSVLQVLQKGYLINDRMLRPARVLVAREPREDEAQAEPDAGDQ